MSDIYTIEFDPSKLSYQQESLGLKFADYDTAVELMKKEEKMIIAELTIYFSTQKNYKNIDTKRPLKKGIKPRLGLKPLRLSEMT